MIRRLPTATRTLLLFTGVLALTACGGGTHEAVETAPPAIYSVRGEVDDLPPEGRPLDWIAIHHEAIPTFVGITGEPEPMASMTMRFPIADGVDLGGLGVGDKLRFDLEVDWNAGDPARVLAVEPLPAETELRFGGGDEHADH